MPEQSAFLRWVRFVIFYRLWFLIGETPESGQIIEFYRYKSANTISDLGGIYTSKLAPGFSGAVSQGNQEYTGTCSGAVGR